MDDDDDDESVAVVVVLSPRPLRLEEKKVQVDDVSPPKKPRLESVINNSQGD